MTSARRHGRRSVMLAVAVAVASAGTSGCARLLTRPNARTTHEAAAIISAGAARERGLAGLRLTLSVRATAGPPTARLAAPAYLAIDGPERLRLQVLSPFGVTVLDLATNGDAFSLTLPLRGETKEGRIDLAALAAGETPEDERMIVALALLFRPKMSREHCRAAGANAVTCAITPDLRATITVDRSLRSVREEYVGADGHTVLVADLGDYPTTAADAFPGRITISAGNADDPALIVRIVRVRHANEVKIPSG